MIDAEQRLAGFLDKFTPEIAAQARTAREKMQALLPGAVEMVYDNYNALAIGYGATERTSDFLFSIAVFPRWVSLFFASGAQLLDPHGLLKDSEKHTRHIVLTSVDVLDAPEVQALIAAVLARTETPIDPDQPGQLVIKSVSAKQRPRRAG